MVKGIGIDAVVIGDVAELLKHMTKGALARVFTEGELSAARGKADPAEYLASRFAVKEAAFKAIAPRLSGKSFDYRRIETRNSEDGSTSMLANFFKQYWMILKLHRSLFPSQQQAAWPLRSLSQNREISAQRS